MYLRDFAESFLVLFSAGIDLISAGIVTVGICVTIALATVPHIARKAQL